ncbi:ERV/ALR sulfhydryl oxidase domain-containing protein [Protomyces lactucae-debilis]|uniref:Sulfhydryl oxidase n=1 Tax=Protomyces lactucae-debilis TaxID=2754530 RepID=A0A1Y2FGF4_PROLT|nr:ERV/ALR sulfhydryl oxidase domain-containing protein [Protomyces lactucae-debilis]ORY82494.1 ERV/ALR sulfhydryl oxidase domain-containing protein [Protomyces lactucae-debilis]
MANETARAALGRSAWHLLHTILARYPEAPSDLEKAKLKSFVGLFGELYPCGECAEDFLQLLTKLPVQTSSRKAAALWGCSIHNEVNKKLGKPEYDCGNVLEKYDCGCGDEPEKPKAAPK